MRFSASLLLALTGSAAASPIRAEEEIRVYDLPISLFDDRQADK
jgi:hypothetical protein